MISKLAMALGTVFALVPDVAPNPVPRVGETLAPRKPTAVEMSAETVRISLQEATARIEATFTLTNTSADREDLEVGFPTAAQPKSSTWNSQEGLKVSEWGAATIQEFSAKVDGLEVKAVPKPPVEKNSWNGWLCWPLSMDGHQKRTVEVRYRVDTRDDNYSEPSALLNRQVTYILKTGAGWKGPIGEAVIILDLEKISPEKIVRVAPEPSEKESSTWTWRMRAFKPTADILVQYRVYATAEEAVLKLGAKLKTSGSDLEAWVDYADNLISLGEPLKTADALGRLDELEMKEHRRLFRARTEYQPPAYRAAKLLHDAGKKEEARAWAKKGVSRLEELGKENLFMMRKALHTTPEAIRKCLDECRAWAEE